MNKKTKALLIILGLVVLMAVPVFAGQDISGNRKFSWGTGRQSNIETIAEKIGIPVEELLEERKSVSSCKDLLEKHNLSCEDIKKARLEQQFKKIDEKVTAGDITKEEGETIKEKIQSHRFLQDCNGPYHGEREGMKLNMGLKRMKNNCGHVKNSHRQGSGFEK